MFWLPSEERQQSAAANAAVLSKEKTAAVSDKIVTPADLITDDQAFMRGHGTQILDSGMHATVAGVVERVNRLISVKALRARYAGSIGDVVIGRISDVGPRRWKVECNAKQDAFLMLSSITLPGGVQRRKQEADELAMRQFLSEGDLVVAEIQLFAADGAASLHTRNNKFGKLRSGSLVVVPPSLIKRMKSHFYNLPFGVHVTIGMNGYIWISPAKPVALNELGQRKDEVDETELYSNQNETIDLVMRKKIARTRNCIQALAQHFLQISDLTIDFAYQASLAYEVKDIIQVQNAATIVAETRKRLAEYVEENMQS